MRWWQQGVDGLVADLAAVHRVLSRLRQAWTRRLVMFAAATFLLCLLGGVAWADGEAGTGGGGLMDTLSRGATDSQGHPMSAFSLQVDEGGVTSPFTAMGAWVLNAGWDVYRLVVSWTLYALSAVLEFQLLALLQVPAETISAVINAVLGDLGIIPIVLVVGILISVTFLFSGRTATGFGEMCVTVLVGGLLTTALANPVSVIVGGLQNARELGMAVTAEVVTGQRGGSMEESHQQIQSVLMDNMVRVPHQYVNYGSHLEAQGQDCVDAYDKVLAGAGQDVLFSACPAGAQKATEAGMESIVTMLFVLPVGLFLATFLMIVGLAVFLLTALVIWEATKFVLELLKAAVPGTGRVGLVRSACTMVVGLAMVVMVLLALGIFFVVMDATFAETAAWSPIEVFAMLNFILVLAIIGGGWFLLVKAPSAGGKLGSALGQKLTPRAGALPPAAGVGRVVMSRANQLGSRAAASAVGNRLGNPDEARTPRATQAGATQASTTTDPGGGGPAAPEASSSAPERSRIAKVARGTGKVAWAATKGTAAYTVGAPVAVPRTVKTAQRGMQASRAVLATRLETGKARAGGAYESRRAAVSGYAQEYGHNVAVAARGVGRYTGTSAAGRAVGRAAGPHVAAAVVAGGLRVSQPEPAGTPQPSTAQHAPPTPGPPPSRDGQSATAGPAAGTPAGGRRPSMATAGSSQPATRPRGAAPAPAPAAVVHSPNPPPGPGKGPVSKRPTPRPPPATAPEPTAPDRGPVRAKREPAQVAHHAPASQVRPAAPAPASPQSPREGAAKESLARQMEARRRGRSRGVPAAVTPRRSR